jgi:ribosomal 50S subunit-associated protein YjgA (DUF615 family)
MWYWRGMEISWADSLINEELLHRVKEERNIRHKIKRREALWIGYMMRRNCFMKGSVEGKDRSDWKTTKKT